MAPLGTITLPFRYSCSAIRHSQILLGPIRGEVRERGESSLETIGTTGADRRQRASIDSIDRPRRGEEHV